MLLEFRPPPAALQALLTATRRLPIALAAHQAAFAAALLRALTLLQALLFKRPLIVLLWTLLPIIPKQKTPIFVKEAMRSNLQRTAVEQ